MRNAATKQPPLVSIGLPVYNGEAYLGPTLEAICAQTLTDFELLISDNASTDGTEAICRSAAADDQRIRYFRNSENLGASANFQRLAELATGRYFIWASHHDCWAPEMLEKCVEVMEADPQVVLCHTGAVQVDDQGRHVTRLPQQVDTRGWTVRRRFSQAIWRQHCYTIYGLLRRSALVEALPLRKILGTDNVMLAELSLLGTFAHIDEPLFYFRVLSSSGDMESLFRRLNIKLTPWTAPGIFSAYAGAMYGIIRRRVPQRGLRWTLYCNCTVRLIKAGIGFFGSLIMSRLFPALYRRLCNRLLNINAKDTDVAQCGETSHE